jgi:FkbM family methyltransferase
MKIKTFIWKVIKAILPHGVVVLWRCRRYRFKIGDVKQAKRFFAENRQRVNAVASILADEKSKLIYTGIVKCRCRDYGYKKYFTKEIQYFDNEFFKYGNDEVLIDCGAYKGDTIDSFTEFVPNYKRIISFEAAPENFEKLKQKHGRNPDIRLINKGVWNETGKISFCISSDNPGGNTIGLNDTTQHNTTQPHETIFIDVMPIDALNLQEKVTFIKMDIEGAELNALKGAEKTILRDKPRLAISIYHSNEDMIRIAEWIHALVPEYKLYVRHHLTDYRETVLYAQII